MKLGKDWHLFSEMSWILILVLLFPAIFFSYARYRPPKRILYNTVHIVHPKLKHNVVWGHFISMMRGKSIWNLCNTWRTWRGRWGTWVLLPDIFGHGLVCRSGHWPHFLRSLCADDSRHEWEKPLLGPAFLKVRWDVMLHLASSKLRLQQRWLL
jgi:hypothetical protein